MDLQEIYSGNRQIHIKMSVTIFTSPPPDNVTSVTILQAIKTTECMGYMS